MGGSGGGGGFGPDELERLADLAKDALRSASQPVKRNVFISFAAEDLDEVNLLRGQAKNEDMPIEFSDRSLQKPFDSENANYIKRGITDRIQQASVTLCYLSDDAALNKWVDWEIRESARLGKGIVAVHKGDSPPSRLPPAVREFGAEVVPWRAKEVMDAIDRATKNR